jgi:DNA-binding beta-propeller fold protein YncE
VCVCVCVCVRAVRDVTYARATAIATSRLLFSRYQITALSTIDILPPDFTRDPNWENIGGPSSSAVGVSHCADIHTSPCGRFVYVSNRGHDSITVMALDESSLALTVVGYCSTGGKIPRSFSIDSHGEYLVVCNQESDTITSFRICSASGMLSPTGFSASTGSPTCVLFA